MQIKQKQGFGNKSDNEESCPGKRESPAQNELNEFFKPTNWIRPELWSNKSSPAGQQVAGGPVTVSAGTKQEGYTRFRKQMAGAPNQPTQMAKAAVQLSKERLKSQGGGAAEASKIRRARLKARDRVSLINMALDVFLRPNQGERLTPRRAWVALRLSE